MLSANWQWLQYNFRNMPDALAVGMVPDELKHEPISTGIDTVRK